ALGSSLAGGYVGDEGRISGGIDELAFVPIDYATGAPVDEWSGDRGCAVQYLSQQGTARLMDRAGLTASPEALLRDRLIQLQELMEGDDENALRVYQAVGRALGHSIAHFSDFYPLRHIVLMGRVMTGSGGKTILESARGILASDYPGLNALKLHIPDERERRHGQAIAAATLPLLSGGA
ncbi:MAG: transcriptional regulator, partial [Elusimicrobia bacterium]